MNRTLTLLALLSLPAFAQTAPAPDAPPTEGASTSTKKGSGTKKEKPATEKTDAPPPAPAEKK